MDKPNGNDRTGTHESTSRGLDAVRERREDLEALAASNLPVAKVAQTLLDAADTEARR